MKKILIACVSVLAIISIVLILQISSLVISNNDIEGKPINLIVDNWAGYMPLYVAYENGFFEEEGVLVKFDILTSSQSIGEEIMKKDSVYDGYPGVYPQILGNGEIDFDSKAVYAFDYSYGGDVIIANPSIKSISDLKGKKVGVVFLNSFSHRFLINLLEKNNLTEDDVEIIEVSAYDLLDALESGKVDAGHTWDPVKFEAVEAGYNIIGSSKETPGLITDILAIKNNIIEERPEDVQKIVNALIKAYDFIEKNEDEAYSLMSNKTGVSLHDLAEASKGIKIFSPEENLATLTDSGNSLSLYKTSEYISDFMLEHKQRNRSFSADELINSSFVENALKTKSICS